MRCYCGEKSYSLLFSANDYFIVRCASCEQVRTLTPRQAQRKQVYNKEDISVYIDKEEMFRALFRRIIDFVTKYRVRGRFMEIGAGVGLLVDEARRAGFYTSGIEPSQAAVLAAQKYFGVHLVCEKFGKNSLKKPANIIVLNHVLEHLPHPHRVIQDIDLKVKKNTLLVIGVPNFNSIMSQLKRGHWQSLIPDQHRWHFTPQTLDRLVLPFGFVRKGFYMENHDRSMHYFWKLPVYWLLDHMALVTDRGEAMLVVYQKI